MFFFEISILNIYLLTLLREKINKIKSIIFSSRVIPFTYYLSRALGDIIFTSFLYAIIYGVLRIGAQNLIEKYQISDVFTNLWGLLFIWKLRYIFISYNISHLITGNIDQVLKYYFYIYSLVNGGFVVIAIYYPKIPFDYVFDSGSIWLYSFDSEHQINWVKEIASVIINFILAVGGSTLIDNYRLNRNFWKQKEGMRTMKAKQEEISKRNTLDMSFQSESKEYCNLLYFIIIHENHFL